MQIQGSINQLLGMTAVGLKLIPNVEKLGKLRDIGKRMSVLQDLAAISAKADDTSPEVTKEKELIADDIVNLSREKVNVAPTEQNWSEHTKNVKKRAEFKKASAKKAASEAADALAVEQARLREGYGVGDYRRR